MSRSPDWNALHHAAIETRADAEMILELFTASLDKINSLVDAENEALQSGRIEDALGFLAAKDIAAIDYARVTELVRRNFIALTRLVPDELPALKERQTDLMTKLNANASLIVTLRALSENLLRGVAREETARTALSTYGDNGKAQERGPRAPARSIIVSTSM